MKIINQTSTEILIASPKKSLIKSLLMAGFSLFFVNSFIIVPFYVFNIKSLISESRVSKINCDRINPTQVNCQVVQTNLLGLGQSQTLDYQFVIGAKLNPTNRTTVNFSFITRLGEREPLNTNSSVLSVSEIVDPINTFIKLKQKSFNYTADNSFNNGNYTSYISLGFLAFSVFFGFALLWSALTEPFKHDEILLEKLESKFQHTHKSIFGSKVNQYQFTDIAKVDVLYSTDSYQNVSFNPRIMMRSGKQYKLATMSDRQSAIDLANGLNRFVYLPEESDPVVKK
jgi:hypothetical protein